MSARCVHSFLQFVCECFLLYVCECECECECVNVNASVRLLVCVCVMPVSVKTMCLLFPCVLPVYVFFASVHLSVCALDAFLCMQCIYVCLFVST